MSVYVIVLISRGITIPINNTTLITLGRGMVGGWVVKNIGKPSVRPPLRPNIETISPSGCGSIAVRTAQRATIWRRWL